jgi:hypothetical protein
VTCTFETREATGDGDRLAHNPEVAGSNPVPATNGNDPRGAFSGVIFMPDGNGFGNIRSANRLAILLPELQSSPIRSMTVLRGGLAVTAVLCRCAWVWGRM